jgi:acyl carrier protein
MGDLQTRWRSEEFEHGIKQIVSRISRINEADLQDHLLIREELGVDSLKAMEIVYSCEKHLGIRIDEGILEDVQTVGDFLTLLRRLSVPHNGLSST